MSIGILALAMLLGGAAAVAALVSGYSVLMALAIYSGCGVLSVAAIVAATALRSPKPDFSRTRTATQG